MQAPLQAKSDADAMPKDTAGAVTQKRILPDNRPAAALQRELAELMINSPRVRNSPGMAAQHTEKTNHTGLPNQLKSGIESLSGMSMDHVRVRYNSDKPAQWQAHAYAQGNEIYLGTGQERHLPHEAWHIVQQAQGRVRPTLQMKAGAVNDDPSLEKEADIMGERAAQIEGGHGRTTRADTETRAHGAAGPRIDVTHGAVAQLTLTPPFRAPAPPLTPNQAAIAADAQAIDAQTDLAYTNTVNRLNDVNNMQLAQFPGVSQSRFTHFATTLQRGSNSQKAMAAGYIIEDQVTHAVSHMPSVTPQVALAAARPDFVITRQAAGMAPERGIVDLTSTAEFGHVMDKTFTPANYTWIWESLYTQIDFTNVGNPVFNAVTQQQVQQMTRYRANTALSENLYELGRQLERMSEGVGRGIDGFGENAMRTRQHLTAARAQFTARNGPGGAPVPLPAATTTQLDQDMAHINALLYPVHGNAQDQPNLTTRIQAIAAKYGLAGNPWW